MKANISHGRTAKSILLLLPLVALLAVWPHRAQASAVPPHKLGEAYVFVRVHDASIETRLEIPIKELNDVLKLGIEDPNIAVAADIEPHLAKIRDYLAMHFELSVDNVDAILQFNGYSFRHIEVANYLMLEFETQALASVPRELSVMFDPFLTEIPKYRNLMVVEQNFRTGTFDNEADVALIFTPDSRRQTLDLSKSSLWQGFEAFLRSGVWHIWIGFDHILFLLALVLPSVLHRKNQVWEPRTSFRDAFIFVLKIVTLFTIAHSVTLALASLGIVDLPSRLVESVIAASVIVAALDIIFPILGKRILLVVFAFGLFHGFGFASNLSHIGLEGKTLVIALVGFNVGVELGQIGIICITFPILFAIRNTWVYRRVLLPAGAAAFVIIAGYWFLERALDINIPARSIARSIIGG